MTENKELLLTSIVAGIYKDLMYESQENEDGLYWDTVQSALNKFSVDRAHNEGVYSGVAGIILFLIQYHDYKKDPDILIKCKKSAQWLYKYCKQTEAESLGLYIGRSGAIYALYQLFKYTEDRKFLDEAIELALDCNPLLDIDHRLPHNISDGISGHLFILVQLYAIQQDDVLLAQIERCLFLLIDSIKINQHGIYWDIMPYAKQPILGFSEGNSGIGYVLNILGGFFESSALTTLAKQAFSYENNQYDHAIKNWPDYLNRKHFMQDFDRYKKKWKQLDRKFFDQTADTVSWSMGAPGIALGRLVSGVNNMDDLSCAKAKAYTYLKNIIQKNDPNQDFTILTGLGGVLLSLHELDKPPSTKLDGVSNEIMDLLVRGYEQSKSFISSHVGVPEVEDYALFAGLTGIGYLILKTINEDSFEENICLPKVDIKTTTKGKLNMPLNDGLIRRKILDNHFPWTLSSINHESSDKFIEETKDIGYADLLKSFLDYTSKAGVLTTVKSENCFAFEKIKYKRTLSTDNYHYKMAYRGSIEKSNDLLLSSISDQKLDAKTLKLSDDVWLHTLKDTQDDDSAYAWFVIESGPYGTEEIRVDKASYLVLKQFEKPVKVGQALKQLLASLAADAQQESGISVFFHQQIKRGLSRMLLTEKKSGIAAVLAFRK